MICTNCNIKSVCKVYDLIKDKKISINECEFTNAESKPFNMPTLNPVRKSRMNNDLRELEKQEFGIEEEVKPEIATCPTCQGTCYDTSIKLCDGDCGNFVCDNCGTSINGKTYCEECYSKL